MSLEDFSDCEKYLHTRIRFIDCSGKIHCGYCSMIVNPLEYVVESDDYGTQYVHPADILGFEHEENQRPVNSEYPKNGKLNEAKNKHTKSYHLRKYYLLPIILDLVLFGVCWYNSLYFLTYITIALLLSGIVSIFFILTSDDVPSAGEPVGCLSLLFVVVITIMYNVADDERYVCKNGSVFHLHKDCSTIKAASDVKTITKAQGWLYGYFSDCKICVKTDAEKKNQEIDKFWKNYEKTQQDIEKFEKKMNESMRYKLIDYLKFQIRRLESGAAPENIPSAIYDYYESECDEYKEAHGYDNLLK